MSVYTENRIYKDVLNHPDIPGNPPADPGTSFPIYCLDFKTVEVTVAAQGDDAPVTMFISNQKLPPDLTQPASPTNQYTGAVYSDLSTGVDYFPAGTPFTVVDGTVKTFNVEIPGARWLYIVVGDITLPVVDVTLFSNFV